MMTKILSSFITLAFAVIGGIVTGWVFLTATMDSKDAEAVGHLRSEMFQMKSARDAEISGLRGEISARFDGQQAQLKSIDENVRILIKRGN